VVDSGVCVGVAGWGVLWRRIGWFSLNRESPNHQTSSTVVVTTDNRGNLLIQVHRIRCNV